MSLLRFHLDEDAEADALIRALRDRGVDLTTSSEAGLIDVDDETQLQWAARKGRVLLTCNAADFCRLYATWLAAGRHHSGIVIAEQQRLPVGEMLRRILRLRADIDSTIMFDRLELLNRW